MKKPLNDYIKEYRAQLENGDIQQAYRGIMQYMMALRIHFIKKYPDRFVAGSLYQGCMDITYFTFTTESLKKRILKIVIIFYHEKMQFEVCLCGQNKQIHKKYWQFFKDRNWEKYNMPPTPQDIVMETVLVENPDFNQLDSLTAQIDTRVVKFIDDITEALG